MSSSPPNIHPAGTFRAEVVDHGFSESKGGTPQLFVNFKTEYGILFAFFALTDKSAEHTMKKIRAMGYAGDDLAELEDGTKLRGNFCMVEVTHEEYNGATKARVGWVNEDGWSPGAKRSETAAHNVSRFNALLKKTPKIAKAAASGKDDEEIPF